MGKTPGNHVRSDKHSFSIWSRTSGWKYLPLWDDRFSSRFSSGKVITIQSSCILLRKVIQADISFWQATPICSHYMVTLLHSSTTSEAELEETFPEAKDSPRIQGYDPHVTARINDLDIQRPCHIPWFICLGVELEEPKSGPSLVLMACERRLPYVAVFLLRSDYVQGAWSLCPTLLQVWLV